jgi:hypothetical protein
MGAYYYAGGHKIDLSSYDDYVAVDEAAAKRAGLEAEVGAASHRASHAGAGVLVTPRAALTEAMLKQLQSARALQPVYMRNGAVVVAMPEVRVEFDNPDERDKVIDLLAPTVADVALTEDTSQRLVLRPTSGSGEDALHLANRIQELANPAAVSVRFVQFVPKPKATAG